MSETKQDRIHSQVSRAYAQALQTAREGGGGCCGKQQRNLAGAAAREAGYGTELEAVPEEAARSSFGCGNPVALAGISAGQVVVDLGAGAGLDLFLAAERTGPSGRVIGVDMTDEMIAAARRNIAASGLANVEVRKGLIEELPVEDACADWIISNCVINLSPDKPRVFREIARVLASGGRFSISDIVAEQLPTWLREHAAAYAACIGGAISESEYVSGLQQAGLEDVAVAERIVYDETQLRGIVGSDLEAMGVEPDVLDGAISEIAGKVWSARFTGRRS